MKFPPPPEPPTGGEEFLHQLADYYHALVEYHQRAAAAAAQQLAHLESLLHPEKLLDLPTDVPYWPAAESLRSLLSEGNREAKGDRPELAPSSQLPTSQVTPTEREQEEPGEPGEPGKQQEPGEQEKQEELEQLLSGERGKMLHLDFIVRKLYGRLSEEELPQITAATRQRLAEGANQGKWSAVPDSPDCWTIDLNHFPDLAPVERDQPQPKPVQRHIPDCDKLSEYGTVKKALAACLEEHSPMPLTIQQVIDWFYPQGLSEAMRKKAYGSISKSLSEGCNRLGWRRVSPGRYVWKQSVK